jgi:signal peptidase I
MDMRDLAPPPSHPPDSAVPPPPVPFPRPAANGTAASEAAGHPEATPSLIDAAGITVGERPLSLRPRANQPTVIDRGESVYVDAWNQAVEERTPVATVTVAHSGLLLTREVIETAILALAIFLAVRGVVQNFRVDGSSMDPTYANGQYVLVNKVLYARLDLGPLSRFVPFLNLDDDGHQIFRGPRRGEVIVFHPPLPNSSERDFIKRVIGLPGEHVQVHDNHVFINGQEVVEPYLHNVQTFCGGQQCDVQLGGDQYYVLGDNRTNSSDSRLWGPVSADKIVGKAWFIYLPKDDFGPAPNQKPSLAPPGAEIPRRAVPVAAASTRP